MPNENVSKVIQAFFLTLLVILLFIPLAATNLWWRELFNSGHTVLFALIALLLYAQLKVHLQAVDQKKIYLLVLLIGVILGVSIEIAQGFLQREASVGDLSNDLFGLLSGLLFIELTRQKRKYNQLLCLMSLLLFFLLGTYNFFEINWHYLQRSKAFPMIISFDENWSMTFVRI